MGSEVRDTDGDLMAGRPNAPTGIEELGFHILANSEKYPPVECTLKHHFAPGVYVREFTMPTESFIIGHRHRTEHLNVITDGHAIVLMDGAIREVKVGDVIKSKAGCRKALRILKRMTWLTIHPTTETDIATLERDLIDESPPVQEFMHRLEELKEIDQHLKLAKAVTS